MIAIINGPNLNMLGSRNSAVYGNLTLENLHTRLKEEFPDTEFSFFQSNCEGEIIDRIQSLHHTKGCIGLVINPGAYAHYSHAIADAITDLPLPAVEVHISNIAAREEFRRTSVTAGACTGTISGLGFHGYSAAVNYLKSIAR